MTAQDVWERCKRELDPSREYRPEELSPILALHPATIASHCYYYRLECVRRIGERGRTKVYITGAAAIKFARERMLHGGARPMNTSAAKAAREEAPCPNQ